MCELHILHDRTPTVAIIDADLIGRKKHRFPNLVCMKLSGYYKEQGYHVELKLDYEGLEFYDKVFISKVFTDTPVNDAVLEFENVEHGGTGFYFDKAPSLPYEVEHHMPDYHLYDDWVYKQIENGAKRTEFKEYLDYSIGFITRGCFRKCPFCVNQKYDKVFEHSPLEEFYDPTRKKICLLDDNFFGCANWKELLQQLKDTGKSFKFKQGLDERILTEEKCELLFSCNYDSDITFAFDDISDYELIERKLKLIRKYTDRQCVFYVLVAFDREDKYDDSFWYQDILDTFKRIELLFQYGMLPYIMRFNKYSESKYKGMYINLARWLNQFSFAKKKSFIEFCTMDCHVGKATERYVKEFLISNPNFEQKYGHYLTMKFNKN